MTATLTLPAILHEDHVAVAARLLAQYVNDKRSGATAEHTNDPFWSGSQFESYGINERDTITSDDIVAVSMLGVNVSAHAALCLTGHQARAVSELLATIPYDVDLSADEAATPIAQGSPAWRLWTLLRQHHNVGMTVASKVMARKRPRLIPVQDKVVRTAVGWDHTIDFWEGMRNLLRDDDAALVRRLKEIAAAAAVTTSFSDLRTLDVVIWMSVHTPATES